MLPREERWQKVFESLVTTLSLNSLLVSIAGPANYGESGQDRLLHLLNLKWKNGIMLRELALNKIPSPTCSTHQGAGSHLPPFAWMNVFVGLLHHLYQLHLWSPMGRGFVQNHHTQAKLKAPLSCCAWELCLSPHANPAFSMGVTRERKHKSR